MPKNYKITQVTQKPPKSQKSQKSQKSISLEFSEESIVKEKKKKIEVSKNSALRVVSKLRVIGDRALSCVKQFS